MTKLFRLSAAVALCLVPVWALAQAPAKSSKPPRKDDYDKQLAYYLEAARRPPVPPPTQATWMSGLALDLRARQVNDLVTIRILESVAAANTATKASVSGPRSTSAVAQPGRSERSSHLVDARPH